MITCISCEQVIFPHGEENNPLRARLSIMSLNCSFHGYIMYNRLHFIYNLENSLSWIPNKYRLKALILHGGAMYIQNTAVKTKKLHRKITLKDAGRKA